MMVLVVAGEVIEGLANQIQNESPEDELLETIDRIKTIKTYTSIHIITHIHTCTYIGIQQHDIIQTN